MKKSREKSLVIFGHDEEIYFPLDTGTEYYNAHTNLMSHFEIKLLYRNCDSRKKNNLLT